MTVAIYEPHHKLINKGGAVLWIPRGPIPITLKDPDIYAQSSIQLYNLGTKLEFADGKVFRYGRWGETNTSGPIARMVVNGNLVPGSAASLPAMRYST